MEALRALGALAETPGPESHRLAGALGLPSLPDPADHTELFTLQLPPYAAIYLGAEGMLGGEAVDRIAGFWRVAAGTPPPEPDHLTTLLAAHASLAEGEASADEADRPSWRRLRHALFWEHVASWAFAYLARAAEVAPPAYRPWAELLRTALLDEAERLGPPQALSLHLREAPPAAAADGDSLLDALLAPARSGVILTRGDLGQAARTIGLGLRQGERRYILRGLFDQAPEETAAWLAEEAERQAALHRAGPASISTIAAHWADRAGATAARLALTPNPQEAIHA